MWDNLADDKIEEPYSENFFCLSLNIVRFMMLCVEQCRSICLSVLCRYANVESIETRRRLPLLRTQDNHYWRGLGADSTSDSLSTLLSASAASVVWFYLTTFPPSVNNMAANKEVWLSIRKLRIGASMLMLLWFSCLNLLWYPTGKYAWFNLW